MSQDNPFAHLLPQPAAQAPQQPRRIMGAPPTMAPGEAARIGVSQDAQALAREKFEYQKQKDAGKGDASSSADPKAAQRIANLNALVEQINRVQQLYEANLKDEAFGPISSIGEYLPTPTNKQFDSAAAGLAEQGLAAFRVPGVGAQSDTELRQFVAANKPTASDYDSQIEEKLRQLRTRVNETRKALGLPPAEFKMDVGKPAQKATPKRPADIDALMNKYGPR